MSIVADVEPWAPKHFHGLLEDDKDFMSDMVA